MRADLLQAMLVGLPIGLHIGAEVGVFSLAGVLARWLGPESMSAHQIAISYASMSFTMALGIGNAGCVRVGWAVGASNTPQARRSGLMAFAAGTGFMVLCALVFALLPLPLALLLGFHMDYGVVGIWWGLCIGLTVVALTLFWRFERQSAGTLHALET